MPTRAIRIGVTAYGSGATSRTAKVISVMRDPPSLLARCSCAIHHPAAAIEQLEELVDVVADILSAVEAAPHHAQPADELVAGIDRNQISVRRSRFIVGHPYEQCLGVVGDGVDTGIGGVDVVPRLKIQLGFGGAGWAGVERHRAAERRVVEEERQADRYL